MRTNWMTLAIAIAFCVTARAQQATSVPQSLPDAGAGAKDAAPSDDSSSTGGLDKSFTANQVVGRIRSLGSNRDSVTLDVAGTAQHYKLGSGTTVFVEGRLGSAQDLKEGQQVRAAFEPQNGEKTVRWIEVTPAVAPAGSEAPAPGIHAPDNGVGIVASIDPDAKQLVLRYGLVTTSILLNDATVVIKGNAVVSTHDIKPGMQVRTTLDATRTTAIRVEILPESDNRNR